MYDDVLQSNVEKLKDSVKYKNATSFSLKKKIKKHERVHQKRKQRKGRNGAHRLSIVRTTCTLIKTMIVSLEVDFQLASISSHYSKHILVGHIYITSGIFTAQDKSWTENN